jgi:cytochrome P450
MWLDIVAVTAGVNAPTYEDLEKLTYLKQVVKEVLRLYPAIPMFPREASMDDILPTGHRVDAGAPFLSPAKLK